MNDKLTWNQKMAAVKAMLQCTIGELEALNPNLLEQYCEDVERIYAAILRTGGNK